MLVRLGFARGLGTEKERTHSVEEERLLARLVEPLLQAGKNGFRRADSVGVRLALCMCIHMYASVCVADVDMRAARESSRVGRRCLLLRCSRLEWHHPQGTRRLS